MITVNPLITLWYRCPKCERSYFVSDNDPHVHLLKKSMLCPNNVSCKGRVVQRTFNKNTSEILNWMRISALELYQASMGLGLPGERNCSPERLAKVMTGSRILKAHLESTGDPKKSILLSLKLDNGSVLHLASSVKGAIIYKVTEGTNVR